MKLPRRPASWSKGYRPYLWRRGLVHVSGDLSNLQRLRLLHGLEHGYVGLTVEWSDGNCDPLFSASIDVTDTWLGRWLLASAIRVDNWRARRHGDRRD